MFCAWALVRRRKLTILFRLDLGGFRLFRPQRVSLRRGRMHVPKVLECDDVSTFRGVSYPVHQAPVVTLPFSVFMRTLLYSLRRSFAPLFVLVTLAFSLRKTVHSRKATTSS